MKTTVVCGFPGVGKTYATKKYEAEGVAVLDLDSSLFSKDGFPDNYIAAIQENIGKYEIIFVSTHEQTRIGLAKAGIKFALVYPSREQKSIYMQRYIDRGSSPAFIDLMDKNWDTFIEDMTLEKRAFRYCVVGGPGSGLTDIVEKLREYDETDLHNKPKQGLLNEQEENTMTDEQKQPKEKTEIWVITAIRESQNTGYTVVVPGDKPPYTPDLLIDVRTVFDAVALVEVANQLLQREELPLIDAENPGHSMEVILLDDSVPTPHAARFIIDADDDHDQEEITVFVYAERKEI